MIRYGAVSHALPKIVLDIYNNKGRIKIPLLSFPPVMRLALVAVAVVPIVTACADDSVYARRSVHARQVFAASSPSNAVASTSAVLSTPAASQVTLSFSLLSTNPTAVPLASISGNAPSAATEPLASTPTAGAQPSDFPSAPPLPDSALFNRLSHTTILH